MPTRADIEVATPKCPRTRLDPAGGLGRVRCDGPLHYKPGPNLWYCERCTGQTSGAEIVAIHDTITSRAA